MHTDETKMKATDRVLVLKIIEGAKAKSSMGLVDSRLMTGENKLHVIKEPDTNFWYFKQESGSIPPALRQKFTAFKYAKEHAENYYRTRNIEVKEVIE